MPFRKTKEKRSEPKSAGADKQDRPIKKIPKPKILLIDCPIETIEPLLTAGFNAVGGSFGQPFSVEMRDGLIQIPSSVSLPNCSEQEIVIVDLTTPQFASAPQGRMLSSAGENAWWCSTASGYVDPRPIEMEVFRSSFDRIYLHGGIFVIFSEPRMNQDFFFGTKNHVQYHRNDYAKYRDNWGFLTVLSRDFIRIKPEYGNEITTTENTEPFSRLLAQHLEGAKFTATFNPEWPLKSEHNENIFFSLLKNKYGEAVGGAVLNRGSKGFVLLLPHVKNKPKFIFNLISEVLPDFAPRWFPDSTRFEWLKLPEYQHSGVLAVIEKQQQLRSQTDLAIQKLDNEIAKQKRIFGYLHGLLTNHDDALELVSKPA